jgi:hypothetical protein
LGAVIAKGSFGVVYKAVRKGMHGPCPVLARAAVCFMLIA